MRVSFNLFAERELNDAAAYFERERPGLGGAFIAEIERCTAAALGYPEAGKVATGSIRRLLCRRFPYALLYTVRPNELRILAAMNLRRRPAYWVGRD